MTKSENPDAEATLVALVSLASRVYELPTAERLDLHQFVGALAERAPSGPVWRALALLIAHVECDVAEDRQIGGALAEIERMLDDGA